MLDYAARVTNPKTDSTLILPCPTREQAERWVLSVNGDKSPSSAELVSRPSDGWQPVQ